MKPVMQENFVLKKSEVDKEHRTNETDDARQLHLTNKREAYKNKMSLLNNQKETNGDKNDSASNFLTKWCVT